MNIFILDYDIKKCTESLVDSHASKMVLETAQLLCTTLNILGVETPYKSCHMNHPCRLWAGKTQQNFAWLIDYGIALSEEFAYRYENFHKSQKVIQECAKFINKVPAGPLTRFAQAMPDEYKTDDAVKSYRNYYNGAKTHLFKWTKRETPSWIKLAQENAI